MSESTPISDASTTVIQPRRGWQPIDLAEIWHYRDLLFFLAWRDVKVRYKQTALGAAWAVIQPLINMVVFTVIFGKLARLDADTSVPYPLLTFTAAVPWALFSSSLTQAGNSLIGSQNLISKVYFPRLIIPFSSILSSLLDFAIAFAVLIVMMLCYGYYPHWPVLLLPLFLAMAVISAMAVGLWLSALNVEYRDVRYTIPLLTQVWLLVSPVGYLSSQVAKNWPHWQLLYGLNPMVSVIDGFRWALLGLPPASLATTGLSAAMSILLLVGGLFYFRRMEKTFADLI